jgi:hypothetical protein
MHAYLMNEKTQCYTKDIFIFQRAEVKERVDDSRLLVNILYSYK